MTDVVIIDAVRSPIGRRNGGLSTVHPADLLANVLRELKGGRVEFRNDRTGIVHSVIGRKSFTPEQLQENLFAFVDAINRSKPSAIKGVYLKSLSISTTMSPGIALNVTQTVSEASSAVA